MKEAYPVLVVQDKDFCYAYVPDFDINTGGISLFDAIKEARDSIGVMGIMMEDAGNNLPEPSSTEQVMERAKGHGYGAGIITYVDVDFLEYRKKHDNHAVRKNVSIPKWMADRVDREDINLSRVLQDALGQMLKD